MFVHLDDDANASGGIPIQKRTRIGYCVDRGVSANVYWHNAHTLLTRGRPEMPVCDAVRTCRL
jgi:hypothetical protein